MLKKEQYTKPEIIIFHVISFLRIHTILFLTAILEVFFLSIHSIMHKAQSMTS